MRWSPKDPREILPLGIDLARLLATDETLIAVSSAIRVLSGTDADPSVMLLDAPTIVGTTVQQWIEGGIDGCDYRLAFTADSSIGKRIVEAGDLLITKRD